MRNAEPSQALSPSVLGELLGLLVHDLRNPLSALHSNLGFIDASGVAPDGESYEAVQDGLISCESLRHMIDNVDLLSQELRGQLVAATGSIRLRSVLEGTIKRCEPVARSHGVSLRLEGVPESVAVSGTPELLHRLFSNLLHNSIQHSPSHTEIVLRVVSAPEAVNVQIDDGGSPLLGEVGKRAFSAPGQSIVKSRGAGRYSRAFGLYCAVMAARCCRATITSRERANGNAFDVTWAAL